MENIFTMENLFKSKQDFDIFCYMKAKARISSLERKIKSYEEDITKSLDLTSKIFQKYGVSTNYISQINDINSRIENVESDRFNEQLQSLYNERDTLYSNYDAIIEKMSLTDKEDLEFNAKKVLNRKLRINDAKDTINEIETKYPGVKDFDYGIGYSTLEIFKEIKSYLSPEEEFEVDQKATKLEDQKEKLISLPYVIRITKAPDNLLESWKSVKPIPKEEVVEASVESDNSFYDPTDNFTSSFANDKVVPLFDEVEEVKTDSLEEKLTFTMEDGISLTTLAKAVCDDENGWYDIYNVNKEQIDKVLKENNISNDEAFEKDTHLFNGVTLLIPNIYVKQENVKRI